MRVRKWLIILLVIVTTMSLATYTGVTNSFFVDDEQSTDDSLGIQWGLINLIDSFDGTPWDANWDGNGTTDWTQSTTAYSAPNSAGHASGGTYLTSDNMDASDTTSIDVTFWFNIKLLNKGPLYVQIYNGSSYDNLYGDLVSYPGVVKNTWIQFSQNITGSQYFISNFSIRFDGSTLTTDAFIDDVLIEKN